MKTVHIHTEKYNQIVRREGQRKTLETMREKQLIMDMGSVRLIADFLSEIMETGKEWADP